MERRIDFFFRAFGFLLPQIQSRINSSYIPETVWAISQSANSRSTSQFLSHIPRNGQWKCPVATTKHHVMKRYLQLWLPDDHIPSNQGKSLSRGKTSLRKFLVPHFSLSPCMVKGKIAL